MILKVQKLGFDEFDEISDTSIALTKSKISKNFRLENLAPAQFINFFLKRTFFFIFVFLYFFLFLFHQSGFLQLNRYLQIAAKCTQY